MVYPLIVNGSNPLNASFISFSVNDLTRKHFNGGGHLNAAGGTLECSLDEAIEKLISILPEYKEELNK